MCEEENVKLRGYLRHKGKKRLISMWRQWYCVLNGHLLLFYRTESEFNKLGKFHDQIDLGLVYDVTPALGVENGIQISTHVGPHWLRCKDEKSYQKWLESLQASIVLRRGATLRRTKEAPVLKNKSKLALPSLRQQKAKSTMPEYYLIQNKDHSDIDDKKMSPSTRFSLNFIPGHGKKYSTFDTHRSFQHGVGEMILEENDETNEKNDPNPESTKINSRLKKGSKKSRPISESVSDFLLLNIEESKKTNVDVQQKDDHLEIVRNKKKNSAHHGPRIPTSFNVGKLLSHLEVVTSPKSGSIKSSSKSMTSLLEVPCKSGSKLSASSSHIESTIPAKHPTHASNCKSEDVLNKRSFEKGTEPCVVQTKDSKDIAPHHQIKKVEIDEKVVTIQDSDPSERPVQVESPPDDKKHKPVRKIKDPSRRKSGIAMLRQFFQSAKIAISKNKGEKSDQLSNTPQRSGKNSREEKDISLSPTVSVHQTSSDGVHDVPAVEDGLVPKKTSSETAIQKSEERVSITAQSVHEENFVVEKAYICEAEALEVCEPELSEIVLDDEPAAVSTRSSVVDYSKLTIPIDLSAVRRSIDSSSSELNGLNRNSIHSFKSLHDDDADENRMPSLPIKTKIKCPSPAYDVPRSEPIPIDSVHLHLGERTKDVEDNENLSEIDSEMKNCHSLIAPDQELSKLPSGVRLSFALSETEVIQEEAIETIDQIIP